jgi:hypothetical protein
MAHRASERLEGHRIAFDVRSGRPAAPGRRCRDTRSSRSSYEGACRWWRRPQGRRPARGPRWQRRSARTSASGTSPAIPARASADRRSRSASHRIAQVTAIAGSGGALPPFPTTPKSAILLAIVRIVRQRRLRPTGAACFLNAPGFEGRQHFLTYRSVSGVPRKGACIGASSDRVCAAKDAAVQSADFGSRRAERGGAHRKSGAITYVLSAAGSTRG